MGNLYISTGCLYIWGIVNCLIQDLRVARISFLATVQNDNSGGKRCTRPRYYYKTKKPFIFWMKGCSYKIWHRLTLPRFTAVPSALAGLTSLFGMGRGGHRRYRHLKVFEFAVLSSQFAVACFTVYLITVNLFFILITCLLSFGLTVLPTFGL